MWFLMLCVCGWACRGAWGASWLCLCLFVCFSGLHVMLIWLLLVVGVMWLRLVVLI